MRDVNKYVGLEFEDCGRGPRYDCWGLVRHVYAEQFNISLPSYVGDYSSCADGTEIESLLRVERETVWVPVETPDCGDVVILRIRGLPWHCGMMLDAQRFLHVARGVNACIDRLDSPRWERRIDGLYRHVSMGAMAHG